MIKKAYKKVAKLIGKPKLHIVERIEETHLLAIGAMLSKQQLMFNSNCINDYEFKIFSQFGDDGIIQYLVKNIFIKNETFIEFGVENYMESNTRFLMMNNNWQGFVMDASEDCMNSLKTRPWFWKYSLNSKAVFITSGNINNLIKESGFKDLGLLHIDLDGNDYHILKAMDMAKINPSIIILEYNSIFGKERAITIPYDDFFNRTNAHFSNLYFGASLTALTNLAVQKGYALVGSNLAGNNAYFVRRDLLNAKVKESSVHKVFKESKFRESRNPDYSLSYLSGEKRLDLIKGLSVLNTDSNLMEVI